MSNEITLQQPCLETLGSRHALNAVAYPVAASRHRDLDTPAEPDFDELVSLAAKICRTAFAAVSFVAEDCHSQKPEFGPSIGSVEIVQSFGPYVLGQDGIFVVTDASRDTRFRASPALCGKRQVRFYAGLPIVEATGRPIAILHVAHPRARAEGLNEIQRMTLHVLARQVAAQLELRRIIIARTDEAIEQRAETRQLRRAATHDALTGLANRPVFQERLEAAILKSSEDGTRTALLLVDVDHFKQINDTLGHDAGDALLRNFATRLRKIFRSTDTVGRLGGDEFGVVLTSIKHVEALVSMIAMVNDHLRQPVTHCGRLVECQASIGIALYPDDAADVVSLTKCADLALAAAKVTRGCAVTFRPTMGDDFDEQERLLSQARGAIERDEVVPYYQPKIDLATGQIVGFEALLRWEQSNGAIGLAGLFAPAFADHQLAALLGKRMQSCVFNDMRDWIDAGVDFGTIAINTCAADFAGNNFAERLIGALDQHGIDPTLVEIEVTEGVFLGRGMQRVARALHKLSARGVRIALDDFGTGFASLVQLKQFPVDVLKIDRSFVAGVGKNPDDTAIVKALIALGSALGMETVAEGVENQRQAAFVRSHGCDVGQGFLYSVALPPSQIAALLACTPIRAAA